MGGCIDKQTDGQVWMDGQMDGWMHGQMVESGTTAAAVPTAAVVR